MSYRIKIFYINIINIKASISKFLNHLQPQIEFELNLK